MPLKKPAYISTDSGEEFIITHATTNMVIVTIPYKPKGAPALYRNRQSRRAAKKFSEAFLAVLN